MAKTQNYEWALPNPYGYQIAEITKIAGTLSAIDGTFAAFEQAYAVHTHSFASLTNTPTTLGGYGITDGMTAEEVAAAIKQATDDLINGSGAALDTLKELADALGNNPNFAASVSAALGSRVRVDAAQGFSAAQKAQARTNIDALGTAEKGATNGLAPLGSDQKVPQAYLPPQTTTATVGAAIAGGAGRQSIADGDTLTGVLAGTSTLVRWTWGNIKAWLQAVFDTRYLRLTGGTVSGQITVTNTDGFRIANGGQAAFFRKDSGSFYLLLSDTETGAWNALRPWRVDIASGKVVVGNGLDVSGSATFTGSIELKFATPHLWWHNPNVKRARWVLDGNGTLVWQDQGGQNHFYITNSGAVWTQQLGDLNSRIEGRAAAYADDRKNGCVIDTRFAGWVTNLMVLGTDWHAPSGYVLTYVRRLAGSSGDQYEFGGRQPQVYIPAVGWRALGAW